MRIDVVISSAFNQEFFIFCFLYRYVIIIAHFVIDVKSVWSIRLVFKWGGCKNFAILPTVCCWYIILFLFITFSFIYYDILALIHRIIVIMYRGKPRDPFTVYLLTSPGSSAIYRIGPTRRGGGGGGGGGQRKDISGAACWGDGEFSTFFEVESCGEVSQTDRSGLVKSCWTGVSDACCGLFGPVRTFGSFGLQAIWTAPRTSFGSLRHRVSGDPTPF